MNNPHLFDWEDYNSFCKFVKDKNYFKDQIPDISESVIRSVISRSYYSAFGRTCKHLEKRNLFSISKKDSHEAVFEKLNSISMMFKESRYSDIGLLLSNMKTKRVKADYRDASLSKIMTVMAKDSINDAERTINLIHQLEQKYGIE